MYYAQYKTLLYALEGQKVITLIQAMNASGPLLNSGYRFWLAVAVSFYADCLELIWDYTNDVSFPKRVFPAGTEMHN